MRDSIIQDINSASKSKDEEEALKDPKDRIDGHIIHQINKIKENLDNQQLKMIDDYQSSKESLEDERFFPTEVRVMNFGRAIKKKKEGDIIVKTKDIHSSLKALSQLLRTNALELGGVSEDPILSHPLKESQIQEIHLMNNEMIKRKLRPRPEIFESKSYKKLPQRKSVLEINRIPPYDSRLIVPLKNFKSKKKSDLIQAKGLNAIWKTGDSNFSQFSSALNSNVGRKASDNQSHFSNKKIPSQMRDSRLQQIDQEISRLSNVNEYQFKPVDILRAKDIQYQAGERQYPKEMVKAWKAQIHGSFSNQKRKTIFQDVQVIDQKRYPTEMASAWKDKMPINVNVNRASDKQQVTVEQTELPNEMRRFPAQMMKAWKGVIPLNPTLVRKQSPLAAQSNRAIFDAGNQSDMMSQIHFMTQMDKPTRDPIAIKNKLILERTRQQINKTQLSQNIKISEMSFDRAPHILKLNQDRRQTQILPQIPLASYSYKQIKGPQQKLSQEQINANFARRSTVNVNLKFMFK